MSQGDGAMQTARLARQSCRPATSTDRMQICQRLHRHRRKAVPPKTHAGVLPESLLKSPARWCILQRASPPSLFIKQLLGFPDSNYELGGRCWRRPKTEPARQRRTAPATITESPIAAQLPGLLGWLSATSAAVSELAQVGVGANRRGSFFLPPSIKRQLTQITRAPHQSGAGFV